MEVNGQGRSKCGKGVPRPHAGWFTCKTATKKRVNDLPHIKEETQETTQVFSVVNKNSSANLLHKLLLKQWN